jgi:hypothetical protein
MLRGSQENLVVSGMLVTPMKPSPSQYYYGGTQNPSLSNG